MKKLAILVLATSIAIPAMSQSFADKLVNQYRVGYDEAVLLGVNSYRVAILGATGAVGQELLMLLAKRHFPTSAVRLLASPRSSGRTLPYRGVNVPVSAVSDSLFDHVQIAFFSAGTDTARTWAPIALGKGAVVIDNSSAFRMDENVPLVIPEINWHVVKKENRLFPVGNCTAIILMMALAPLQQFGNLKRVVVSTYQSVSGAGAACIACMPGR